MKNPITITLSYSARMLVATNGGTPPTRYRIDAHEVAPAYVCDHVDAHGVNAVTVTADDIQAHGGVTEAAAAILTEAAPDPDPAPDTVVEHDLTRAYAALIDAVSRDERLYSPAYMPRAQALACNNIERQTRTADVRRIARDRGASPENAEMYVRHATSAARCRYDSR